MTRRILWRCALLFVLWCVSCWSWRLVPCEHDWFCKETKR